MMVMDNLIQGYFCNSEESKDKEALKYFQYAAGIFDKIKNESLLLLNPNELPSEFNTNYLSFVFNLLIQLTYLCLGYAQVKVFQVSEKSKLNLELQSSLAFGIYELLTNAFNLACSISKFVSEENKIYIRNRRFYYNAISLIKYDNILKIRYKDYLETELEKNGTGFGKMIGYTNFACESLNESLMDIGNKNKCVKNYDFKDVINYKEKCDLLQKELLDKNRRIYFGNI